jgi:hypothetical protein
MTELLDLEDPDNIIAALADARVTLVTGSFSGSGDEGSFYDFSYDRTPYDHPDAKLADLGRWLEGETEDLCERLVGAAGYDGYENNDGGEGQVFINVTDSTARVEFAYNGPIPEPHKTMRLGPDGAVLGGEVTSADPSGTRAWTEDEVRVKFLNHVWAMARYWASLDGSNVGENETPLSRITGFAHSLLAAIDGSAMALPAFKLIPVPHPTDRVFHKAEGENWYPGDVDIAGSLHELLYADAIRKDGMGNGA